MLIGSASKVLKYDGSTDAIPVAGEVTVYSRSFPMSKAQYFGISALCISGTGTAAIKIELEEGWQPPATEGSADATVWGIPDGFDEVFAAIADEIVHQATIAPVPMSFGRYKITGNSGNPADTLVYIKNFMQEPS